MNWKKIGSLIVACVIIVITLVACNSYERDRTLLDRAEALLETDPDSAVVLLDSVLYPHDVGEEYYNRYLLVQIQAKDKSDRSIAEDTLLFGVQKYYIINNQPEKAAIAGFYCGRIQEQQRLPEQAIATYTKAEKYASQTRNYKIAGLIHAFMGNLQYEKLLMAEALDNYKKAQVDFNKAGDYKSEVLMYSKIGASHTINKDIDSAFMYYHRGLELARRQENTKEQSVILQNMGVTAIADKNYERGRAYFRQAKKFSTDEAALLVRIAISFSEQKNVDSARHYISRINEIERKNQTAAVVEWHRPRIMSQIEEIDKNYEKALEYHKVYADRVVTKWKAINDQALVEAKRKYNYEYLKNENNTLLIEKQGATITSLILILCIFILVFLYFWKNYKRKEVMLTTEQKISQLRAMSATYTENNVSSRDILLHHFDILKKTALIETYLRDDERVQGQKLLRKINETVYGQESLDWNKLYQTMNQLYDGLMDQLHTKFPELDETEFRICCLTYAELTNQDISFLMGFKVNTIQAKKSTIRRKLGIDGYGNIIDFLNEKIESEGFKKSIDIEK